MCLFLLCLSFVVVVVVVVVCVVVYFVVFQRDWKAFHTQVPYITVVCCYLCLLKCPILLLFVVYFLVFQEGGRRFILKCPILLSCLTSTAVHYWFARARCKAIQPREALCREALCHTAVFLLNAHSMPVSVPKWWLTRV